MFTVILSLIRRKRKKYLALMLGITVCFLFIIIVDTVYQSSSRSQLVNAYSYEGEWDICVKIENEYRENFEKIDDFGSEAVAVYDTTYNLRLDPVPEDEITDAISYVEYRYLAIHGMEPGAENVLGYELIEGRFPENENEIVIPSTLQYDGKAADKGTISVGDHLTFLCGRRINEEGMYTQENVTGSEVFEECGEKEYVVCGIIEYMEYHSAIFVLNGFVGMPSYDDKADNELSVYYKLDKPSLENMKELYQLLNSMEGVISIDNNSMVVSALEIMEKSDYVRTLKYGVYIFEMLLAFIGFSIIAVEQYQSINDDRILISRMHCIGAERRQLCRIYSIINAMTLTAGYLLSLLIGWGILAGIAKKILPDLLGEQTELFDFTPNILYTTLLFVIMMAVITYIVCRCVAQLLPESKSTTGKRRWQRQSAVNSLWKLAVNNSSTMKKMTIIKTIIICIVLICVPLFISVFVAAVATSKSAYEFYPCDYGIVVNMQLHKNIDATFDKELQDNENIKEYYWESWEPRKIMLEKECFPDDVYDYCIADRIDRYRFNDNGQFYDGIYLTFIGEDFYGYLNEINGGMLPPYEEFISGDNCIVLAEVFIPENGTWDDEISADLQEGEWISFGKNIVDHQEKISFESWLEGYENFDLNVFSYINKSIVSKEKEDGIIIRIYAPESIYEKYCAESSTYIGTEYIIWGYDSTFPVLYSNLEQMKKRYDFALMDYVTQRDLIKDTVSLQLIASVASILAAILMCFVAIIVLEKMEYISRRQSFETYKVLGLGKKEAFAVRIYEHAGPMVNAMLISLVFYCIGAYTFLRSILSFYAISLAMIGKYFIPTVLVVMVLLVLCSCISTERMYRNDRQIRGED